MTFAFRYVSYLLYGWPEYKALYRYIWIRLRIWIQIQILIRISNVHFGSESDLDPVKSFGAD